MSSPEARPKPLIDRFAQIATILTAVPVLAVGASALVVGLVGTWVDAFDSTPWPVQLGLALGSILLLSSLASAIGMAIVRHGENRRLDGPHHESPDIESLQDAHGDYERELHKIGHSMLEIVCSRPNPQAPLSPRMFREELTLRHPKLADLAPEKVDSLVLEIQRSNKAPGLALGSDGYFVPEDHISFKRTQRHEEKVALSRFCAYSLVSGCSVALDGGSTTLPIALAILERVRCRELRDMTLVTNSVPIVAAFVELASDAGWADDTSPVTVLLCGGNVRPTTQAVGPGFHTPHVDLLTTNAFTAIVKEMGQMDYAFVGANGVSAHAAITMPTGQELEIKQTILENARHPYIVVDSSKWGTQFPHTIAGWGESRFERMEIVTTSAARTNPEFAVVRDRSTYPIQVVELG